MTPSRLTWVPARGAAWPLDGSRRVVCTGADGLFSMSADLTIDARVGVDGGVLINDRKAPRQFMLRVMVVDDNDPDGALAAWREFVTSLGYGGFLRYEGEGNPVANLRRMILDQVVLESQGRSMTGLDMGSIPADEVPVSMLALDPWWINESQWGLTLPLGGTSTGFDDAVAFDAALPFDGGASVWMQNTGSVPIWPLIELRGPITSLTVVGPGWSWELARPLAAGQLLGVRHTPNGRGWISSRGMIGPVLASANTQVDWSWLTDRSQLGPIPIGIHSIRVGSTGSDGDSLARMLYHERRYTP